MTTLIKNINCMVKISNLLATNEQNGTTFNSECYIRFAFLLNISIQNAKAKLAKNGVGYIYSKTGVCVIDSTESRKRMIRVFGGCIVVGANHILCIYKQKKLFNPNVVRLSHHQICKQEKEELQIMLERDKRRVKRETLDIFREGTTSPTAKRGGRGNAIEDIGKFKNCPSSEHRPSAKRDIFMQININI